MNEIQPCVGARWPAPTGPTRAAHRLAGLHAAERIAEGVAQPVPARLRPERACVGCGGARLRARLACRIHCLASCRMQKTTQPSAGC